MDNADIANDIMLERMERQLAARKPARVPVPAEECEGCGEPIPFERVQALAKLPCLRCVDCQQLHEKRGARG